MPAPAKRNRAMRLQQDRSVSASPRLRGPWRPPSLRPDNHIDRLPDAPGRRDQQARMKRHLEVDVDAMPREEAVDVGIVERLHADDVGARRETLIWNSPSSPMAKPPVRVPVLMLNATTWAPRAARFPRRTRPRTPPVAARKSPSGYRSDTPAMSSGCSSRSPSSLAPARSETSPRRRRARGGRRPAAARFRRSPNDQGRGSARSRAPQPIRDRTDRTAPVVDHANAELKKTSDSTISPVMMSTTNVVAPSTRSISG